MNSSFLPQQLKKRLTQRAQEAIVQSGKIAHLYPLEPQGKPLRTHPVHLLYALSLQKGALAKTLLTMQGIASTHICSQLKEKTTKKKRIREPYVPKSLSISPLYKKILKRALLITKGYGQILVGTEHLLYALVDSSPPLLPKKTREQLHRQLEELFVNSPQHPLLGLRSTPYISSFPANQIHADAAERSEEH